MKRQIYQSHDPVNHFFPLPDEIFSLGLTVGEIAVYAYLMYCEDRETYQCYPSYRTIAEALKLGINTVRKYISQLEDKHLISTEPTMIRSKSGTKKNGSLLYTILPIDSAMQFYFDEQIKRNAEIIRKQQIEEKLRVLKPSTPA